MANAPAGSEQNSGLPEDVRPVVGVAKGGSWWIVATAGMVLAGVLLFLVLNARRQSINAPAVRPAAADEDFAAARSNIPPLYVPPPIPEPEPAPLSDAARPAPVPIPVAPQPQPQIIYVPQPAPVPTELAQPAPPRRTSSDPTLVVDTSAAAPAASPGNASQSTDAATPQSGAATGGRVRASLLANRATTVPQGTLIPAVLETGIDSTRPGLARAVVSQDISGFDGTRVLIPRGSKLIGEYASDAQPGQKRALVNWTRLIRPDGVTINIGSPASDPLGRGGIRAKVNTHFFAQFTGAILQSALDIGVAVAARSSNSPVVVALPGTVQTATQSTRQQQTQVTPTLRVRPGTSINVFVARDLDFSTSERGS